MDWAILTSIAFNESSLQKRKIGLQNPNTKDYGLMQINASTARRLHLDLARLLSDEEYNLEAACKVLAGNKSRYASVVPYWLGLYRSGVNIKSSWVRRNAMGYDRLIRKVAKGIELLAVQYTEVAYE